MPKLKSLWTAIKQCFLAVFCCKKSLLIILSLFFQSIFILSALEPVSAASISAGSTAYTASLSTGDTVNIPQTGSIIPTADSKIYTSTPSESNLKFSSTCPKGSSISVNTDNTSNALVHVSDSSKTIPATSKAITPATSAALNPSTGSSLADNTWGLSLDSGNTFAYVPAKDHPAVLFSSNKAEGTASSPITIPVQYGLKINNKIDSGTYSTGVVYTLVVSGECLTYPLSFDANGGTIANTAYNYNTQNLNYGQTINLANYKPKKDGYVFAGWTATYTKADGSTSSSSFSGSEGIINPNPDNSFVVKLRAEWKKEYKITYNLNGGVINNAPSACAEGDRVTIPLPTKSGYSFSGWIYGDNQDEFEMIVSCNKDSTFTAKWGKNVWSDTQWSAIAGVNVTYNNGTFTVVQDGSSQWQGILFPKEIFTEGKRYYVHYKTKKTSGTLHNIQGHSVAQANFQRFYINDVLQKVKYHDLENDPSDVIVDDNREYDVRVYFDYNATGGDDNFYIELNRGHNIAISYIVYDFGIYEIEQ